MTDDDHTIIIPPNLDAMTAADLGRFQKNAKLLHDYAYFKTAAMGFRAQGKIKDALIMEGRCEAIYGLLPEAMRW